MCEDGFGAFRVRHDKGFRVLGFGFEQAAQRERIVDDAGALPDLHIPPPCLALHISAQISIRQEKNGFVGGN